MSFRVGIASLVVCLIWSAAAFASSTQYNGPAASGNGAGVEFGLQRTRGKQPKVRRFEFHNIPAQCKGYAPTAVSGPLTITMKVSSRRTFSGTESLNGGRQKVHVTGTFKRGFGKATGTLRVTGSVPGCASADTAVVRWSAPTV